MHPSLFTAGRGAAAGVFGSVVQAALGATESALILPEHEDANLAPRLMDRLARDFGKELSLEAEWLLGTLFHLGYGAMWGILYSLADEECELHPAAGGVVLGALIYALAFPRWGAAVRTQAERPPHVRTHRMTFVAASAGVAFGLSTAYASRAMKVSRRTQVAHASG